MSGMLGDPACRQQRQESGTKERRPRIRSRHVLAYAGEEVCDDSDDRADVDGDD